MRSFAVFIATFLVAATGFCAVVDQIGTYANWATSWTSLGGYDIDNGETEYLDFVGDASNPGLYYANTNGYVFFRMRVDIGTFTDTTASGAHLLLIDIDGYGVTGIDYGFAWDSKSVQESNHGLEMCVAAANGPTWGASQLNDIDGTPSAKTTLDINGFGRTTDGYVRTDDAQSTVPFGTTTFVDFAVKWSYLEANTNLRSNQTWRVAAASIDNATDHVAFNEDVMGANLTDGISAGWSDPIAVPEPATITMLGLAGVLGFFIRRWKHLWR